MPEYLCNLVIPGAAKSGTSSLHSYLDQHPQICMSSSKEPQHFCRSDRFAKGSAYHNALFRADSGTKIFGESSTGYLIWPPAIDSIKLLLRDPKIIMVLRDPIERVFSHYCWRFRLGLEKRELMQAVQEDGDRYHPDEPDKYGYMAYLKFSRYSEYCPLWISAFGSANVLLIDFERLRTDLEEQISRIHKFLGVPPVPLMDTSTENETKNLGRRTPTWLTRMGKPLPSRLKQNQAFETMKQRLLKITAPQPPMNLSSAHRIFLREELADDIRWYGKTFSREPSE